MIKEEYQKMGLVFFVAFSLRVGISSIPPLIPMLQQELAISDVAASLLTSIPVICMGIFALTVSFIQEKLGRRNGILVFLLMLSIAVFARAITFTYFGLVGTAFMVGVGTAIIGPLLSGYIKADFPTRSGLLIGIYSISMGLGASISSGSVMPLTHYFGGRWNVALASFGFLALIGFFSWKKGTKQQSQPESLIRKSALPLRNRQAWKITLFFGIQSGIFYGFTTWITTIAYSRGVSIEAASLVLTFYTLVQMAFSFLIPMLMDYVGQVKYWSLVCSFLVFIGIAGLFVQGAFFWFVCATFVIGVGLGGLFPIALLLPLKMTRTAEETSAWTGMVQSFGYIIGGMIPIVMGIVADRLPMTNASLWLVMLLSLILMGITLRLNSI